MGFLSSIVSAATGGISDALGITNELSGKQQQADANRAAMTAWTMANDYNHPVAQMQRLKEAGLNPNLVYGSGSVTGNTSGAPALVGGQYSTGGETIFKGLSNIIGTVQGKANIDNTIAQTGAHNAAAAASGAQAANLGAQAAINETRNRFEEKSLLADLDYKKALAAKTKAETKKTKAEASIAQGEADIFGSVGGVKGASGAVKSASFLGKSARFLRGVLK